MTQPQSDNHAVQPMLPLNGRAAIYARVASPAKTTQAQQTDTLITLATQLGYSIEHIVVYEDKGVSGKQGISERGSLQKLMQELVQPPTEQGSIQAILVQAEDRLFRDADAVQVSLFIKICLESGVLVITPTLVYNFQNPAHVTLFRFHCEQSTIFVGRTKKQQGQKRTAQKQ